MLVRLMLLHCMALFSVRLLCKKLGNLQEFFGQMVYPPPPPLEKIARTPMRNSVLLQVYFGLWIVIAGEATQHSFVWGGFAQRTNPLTLHLAFLTENIPFCLASIGRI